MKFLNRLFIVSALALMVGAPSWAVSDKEERRLALVLGNARYDGLANLPNVKNDARLISKKLRALGFDTKVVLNSSRKKMLKSINDFGKKLDDNDVALFYYAGHAVQHKNVNYMIPSRGAASINNSSLEYDAVDLSRVIAQMRDAKSNTNIIIMDACRDNPFKSSTRARGLGNTQGLAVPSSNAKGLYIAYSTSPGAVALDNVTSNSRYSPYTNALANYIDKPGLGINDIFTRVRSQVIEETGNNQVPWEVSSLTSDFYFSSEQSDEEKANERKIEQELANLKAMLAKERQAKAEAEKARKASLELLEQKQMEIVKTKQSLEAQQKSNTQQALPDQNTKPLANDDLNSSLAQQLEEMKKELELARKEQLKLEKAEAKRLKIAQKEKRLELERQRKELKNQRAQTAKQEKMRRKAERAELKKIEQLELEEKDKLARIEAKKKEQAERELKVTRELLDKERVARKKAEEKAKALAEAEALKARQVEEKLMALLARQDAARKAAERLEQQRRKEIELEKDRMLAQAELKAKELAEAEATKGRLTEEKLMALLARQDADRKAAERLALKRQKKDELEKKQMLAQIAESEKKRLEQERQTQLALRQASETEKAQLGLLTQKLAEEEEKRRLREKQLVVAMVKNCEALLTNSSPGKKVLSCYQDILNIDESNAGAKKGLKKLQTVYQRKIAASLNQNKLGRVGREYAILQAIDPVSANKRFGELVEKLKQQVRASTEDSSKRVLPTF